MPSRRVSSRPNRPTIGRAPYTAPILTPTTRRIPWAAQYKELNWLRLKAAILTRDGHKCRRCFTNKQILEVHHRAYYGDYIWSVAPKDLITLCRVCHKRIHSEARKRKGKGL